MSLSRELQTAAILECRDPRVLRETIMQRGITWYSAHPLERDRIAENLSLMGLDSSSTLVDKIIENILLHYYEKIAGLCHTPESFHRYLLESTDCSHAQTVIDSARGEKKAVLLAIGHFGAVELIAPALAARGYTMTVALRFKTEQLASQAREQARVMHESGLFGTISFIEIGKPGTVAALEMAAVVRSGGILISIFDEDTNYSIPVTLLGKALKGGSGIDKLIAFSRAPLAACSAFMVREKNERYTLAVSRVADDHGAPVQALYDNLAKQLEHGLEQWYFLHEEIPFATDSATESGRIVSR